MAHTTVGIKAADGTTKSSAVNQLADNSLSPEMTFINPDGSQISPATADNQASEITALGQIVTNTTGIATATKQDTTNTTLATIASTLAAATPAGSNVIGSVDAAGTKITAAVLPTGGVGFLGWLSAIWYQLTQVLFVNLTHVNSNPISQGSGTASSAIRVELPTNGTGTVLPISGSAGGITPNSWKPNGTAYQQVIKASSGKLFKLEAFNADTVNHYLTVYNVAANPNRASDTPVSRIIVPPGGYVGKFAVDGELFSTGIAFTYTKGTFVDTEVTPVAVNTAAVNYGSI